MSPWRLEVVRIVRTRWWVAVVGVYLLFGLLGPISAAYLGEILERFGGGIEIVFPDPVPADGITQYLGNVTQLGLLVVVAYAASVLAFDAKPEIGVFLRTRARSVGAILLPRAVVATGLAGAAFVLGALAAWYETVLLLGPLPAGAMLAGMAAGVGYLALVVAVTAAAASLVRTPVAAVGIALVVLLVMPLLAVLPPLAPWMPSRLAGALDELVRGLPARELWRAALVTVLVSAAAYGLALRRLAAREL